MKTERFTAVKRSVLYEYHRICVLRSLLRRLYAAATYFVLLVAELLSIWYNT